MAICAYGQPYTPRCRIRGDAREQHHLLVYHAIKTDCPLASRPLATPPHPQSKVTTPHHWIAHALWAPTTPVAPIPMFLPLAEGDSVAGCWTFRAMPALPGACCPIRAVLVLLTWLGWCPPRSVPQCAAPGHRTFCLRRDLVSVGALRSVPLPVCVPSSSFRTDYWGASLPRAIALLVPLGVAFCCLIHIAPMARPHTLSQMLVQRVCLCASVLRRTATRQAGGAAPHGRLERW